MGFQFLASGFIMRGPGLIRLGKAYPVFVTDANSTVTENGPIVRATWGGASGNPRLIYHATGLTIGAVYHVKLSYVQDTPVNQVFGRASSSPGLPDGNLGGVTFTEVSGVMEFDFVPTATDAYVGVVRVSSFPGAWVEIDRSNIQLP